LKTRKTEKGLTGAAGGRETMRRTLCLNSGGKGSPFLEIIFDQDLLFRVRNSGSKKA